MPCTIDKQIVVGSNRPLTVIAGPCVLESVDLGMKIAESVAHACGSLGLPFVFKASFDKANRTSASSPRGPGIDLGLDWLTEVGERIGVPITTDIHAPEQAHAIAERVDLLQIPAFLCRQTDLIVATAEAASTFNRAMNIKKGQFLSPAEMAGPVGKALAAGCENLMLTERGTFFGYHRLVNDFLGIGDLMELTLSEKSGPWPVCFDCTHSTQAPGEGQTTGGRPDRAPLLARAAVAAGVHAVFIECHPEPAQGASDAATMLPLETIPALLKSLAGIHAAINCETLAESKT